MRCWVAMEHDNGAPWNAFRGGKKAEDQLQAESLHKPQQDPISSIRYRMWDHGSVKVCNDCGSLVSDPQAHNRFHANH